MSHQGMCNCKYILSISREKIFLSVPLFCSPDINMFVIRKTNESPNEIANIVTILLHL